MNPSVHYIDAGLLAPTGDHSSCERFWFNIKAQHAAIYGSDSAYNFAACNQHGIRMDGRGWGRDSAANGVQGGVNYNVGSRAIVMLVGSEDVLTPQLQRAVNDFAEEAYRRGMSPPLKAHSDFVATSCCGDNGRALVAAVNSGTSIGGEFTVTQMQEIMNAEWDTRDQVNKHTDKALETLKQAIILGNQGIVDQVVEQLKASGAAGGLSEEQVRAIVRAELDATKLGT